METKVNYVCSLCGSENILEPWCDDDIFTFENGYCNDCCKKVHVMPIEAYKRYKKRKRYNKF